MKKRFGFYFDQSERRNEFLTREKIVSSNHKPRFKRIVFSRAFSRSSRSLQYRPTQGQTKLYWFTNLGFAYFVIFKRAVPYLIRIEMFAILCTSSDFRLVIFSHVNFSKNLIFRREFNAGVL